MAVSTLPINLLEMQILGPHPRSTESEIVSSTICILTSPPDQGPQPPEHGLIPVRGLLGIGPHSRSWAACE